ncbi:hypothetical protein [Tardiphaga sp.]|uniref:hypothetical protein n=1 Tax=Tardiphaga sp. TaxID=1926292 RepID=UPI0025DDE265|nr:hypothetical protein [Tardiphaga sp.]
MASDPDRLLGVEPGLALRFASGVAEDQVTAAEDHVRDDLLVRRVVLHVRPGTEARDPRREKLAEVTIGVGLKPLEPAEPVEGAGGRHEDADGGGRTHGKIFQ